MPYPKAPPKSKVVLDLGGRRKAKYLSSQREAIESFRALELDEATLRPVRGSWVEPARLQRTKSGAVVRHRRAS